MSGGAASLQRICYPATNLGNKKEGKMATRVHFGRAGLCVLAAAGAVSLCLTAPAKAVCVGDCNGSGMVEINELILGVNIALGNTPVSMCPSFACTGNDTVPINCLLQVVLNDTNGSPRQP